jgi:hypothetical protein
MKTRRGFVSNSSSTIYSVTNLTDETLTIVDLAQETVEMGIVEDFIADYGTFSTPLTREGMITSAENRLADREEENTWVAKETKPFMQFGDEDGDTMGHIYDYMLRNGHRGKKFLVQFVGVNR